jgi:hypothetical protein
MLKSGAKKTLGKTAEIKPESGTAKGKTNVLQPVPEGKTNVLKSILIQFKY